MLIDYFFRSKFYRPLLPEEFWHPSTDIYTTGKEIIVRIELAGVKMEDIQIILDGKKLIVQGIKRNPAHEEERVIYQQMEITYGPFRSIFSLPSNVDTKKVKTNYKNGFLEIKLPLAQELNNEVVVINLE